jgi:FliI/YscN family ATPase
VNEAIRFDKYQRAISVAPVHRPSGTVLEIVGLVVEVGGLQAGVGDILEVATEHQQPLGLEVIGFRSGRLLATPLGAIQGVHPGATVVKSGRGSTVGVGKCLLGRVVDAFGIPIDGLGEPEIETYYPVHAPPPHPFARRPIDESLETGLRAIDGMLTLGRGQRVGIFAGAGIGKSTLLGMICRSSKADATVIGLIGERGREVNDFVRAALGPEGLKRSLVVAATSDQPPLVRARGAETATAAAEYLRDQGMNVLLVMDSLTRYAMALREAALASGEPPATKGYPPSVFAALPRLVERAGTSSGKGVMTAFYTVLVEGDDLSDPVADATRSLLDGHIVLSRALGERGHYPAIDVLQSVSRLATAVATASHIRDATTIRELLASYREAIDLVQVGAYVAGTDPKVDVALKMMPQIEAFLRQGINEGNPMDETIARMRGLAGAAEVR